MYKRVSKCLVSLLLIFFMSINTMNVYAEGQHQETLAVSEFNQAAKAASGAWFVAEISPISHRFYTIPVKYAGEIKVTKGNSCSSVDTMCVQVYKANDKKHPVTWGYIYEGQGSATLYIRNSENYRTKPGTYYVVVAKMYRDSSFNYSLTWLK